MAPKKEFAQLRACPAFVEKFDRNGAAVTLTLCQPSLPQHEMPITDHEVVNALFKRKCGRAYFESGGKKSDKEFDDLETRLADQLIEVYRMEERYAEYENGPKKRFIGFVENLGLRKVLVVYGDDETMRKVAEAISEIGGEAGL